MIYVTDAAAQERAKYNEIWAVPEYKKYSPGLENVERFLSVVQPSPRSWILDAGCGTGAAGLAFERRGFRVKYLDITGSGLDEGVPVEAFIEQPLWDKIGGRFDYGFCCDVMEHIPVEFTMLVASRIVEACSRTWFQIAYRPDAFGKVIGQPLHLTVMPHAWWLVRLAQIGEIIDARDLCRCGVFLIGQK